MDILLRKIYIRKEWIICKYFPSDEYNSYSYLQVLEFTNYSYSYSYRSWLCKSIPIPICAKNYYLLITDLKKILHTDILTHRLNRPRGWFIEPASTFYRNWELSHITDPSWRNNLIPFPQEPFLKYFCSRVEKVISKTWSVHFSQGLGSQFSGQDRFIMWQRWYINAKLW